jgi:hypothetical protein
LAHKRLLARITAEKRDLRKVKDFAADGAGSAPSSLTNTLRWR